MYWLPEMDTLLVLSSGMLFKISTILTATHMFEIQSFPLICLQTKQTDLYINITVRMDRKSFDGRVDKQSRVQFIATITPPPRVTGFACMIVV
jgi:hypothetical protein